MLVPTSPCPCCSLWLARSSPRFSSSLRSQLRCHPPLCCPRRFPHMSLLYILYHSTWCYPVPVFAYLSIVLSLSHVHRDRSGHVHQTPPPPPQCPSDTWHIVGASFLLYLLNGEQMCAALAHSLFYLVPVTQEDTKARGECPAGQVAGP